MIHVDRGAAPAGFEQDSEGWWDEFQAFDPPLSASTFWNRVRRRVRMRRDYAPLLYEAFSGKCAFCESKMAHVSPAQIEHYRPKGINRFHRLMFRWDNWLLSCQSCNSRKGDRFPECGGEPCLIDPSQEQPAQHLGFAGAQILNHTERGRQTIDLVGLGRDKLEDYRGRWLFHIDSLLLLVRVPEARANALNYLIWAKQDDAPYTAMTRDYLLEYFPAFTETEHPRVNLVDPIAGIHALVDEHRDAIAQLLQ